ncbi:MAG: hypothetical protein ACOX4Y_09410 [Limnochordia bacterium]|jgi:hypothetical protein
MKPELNTKKTAIKWLFFLPVRLQKKGLFFFEKNHNDKQGFENQCGIAYKRKQKHTNETKEIQLEETEVDNTNLIGF